MANVGEVTVSVLGLRENDEWCALALEMDLRGYGQTFEEAKKDLQDSIEMQISFARFKEETNTIFHPAEPVYFSLFAQIRADELSSLGSGQTSIADMHETESEYAISGMPMPPAHVIAGLRDKFALADG